MSFHATKNPCLVIYQCRSCRLHNRFTVRCKIKELFFRLHENVKLEELDPSLEHEEESQVENLFLYK